MSRMPRSCARSGGVARGLFGCLLIRVSLSGVLCSRMKCKRSRSSRVTVLNEGAARGILVTTSHYAPSISVSGLLEMKSFASHLANNLFASSCDNLRPIISFGTCHLRSSSWPSVNVPSSNPARAARIRA
jgi:hypothetical protein